MKGIREVILVSAAAAVLSAGCAGEGRQGSFEAAVEKAPVLRNVEVGTVESLEVDVVRELAGSVGSASVSHISSRLMGQVLEVRAGEGDSVEKGALLVVLDGRELEAKVRQAEGALGQARAQFELASVTLGRYEKLLAEKAISHQEYDQVVAGERVAGQAVAQAESAVEEARTWLAFTEIRSPVSGRVVSKKTDPGSMASPGMPILSIEPEGGYRIELPVDVSLWNRIGAGTALQVAVEAAGFSGTVVVNEVVPTIDPASRTFIVRADLPDGRAFRSGQYVRAKVTVGARKAIAVPASALVRRGQLDGVYAVDPRSGNASFRIVRVGREFEGGRVEVLSGLTPGDLVVTGGTEHARDGAVISLAGGGTR